MNIYKEMMKKTFKKLCVHKKKYKPSRPICLIDEKDDSHPWGKTIMLPELFEGWKECNACVLRNIPWGVSHSLGKITRDVCFAIWHNGIFERVA